MIPETSNPCSNNNPKWLGEIIDERPDKWMYPIFFLLQHNKDILLKEDKEKTSIEYRTTSKISETI